MHLMENLLENMVLHWTGDFKGLDAGKEDYILDPRVWETIGEATEKSSATIPSAFGRKLLNIAEDRAYFTRRGLARLDCTTCTNSTSWSVQGSKIFQTLYAARPTGPRHDGV